MRRLRRVRWWRRSDEMFRVLRYRENTMNRQLSDVMNTFNPGFARLFDLLEIAEEEINRHGNPQGVFKHTFPTPVLREYKSVFLYRSHVIELVRRHIRGEDLAPGTDAECLASMMLTTLRAPLTESATAVVEYLFDRVASDAMKCKAGVAVAREAWPGQVLEDLKQIRRRLAQPSRKVNDGEEEDVGGAGANRVRDQDDAGSDPVHGGGGGRARRVSSSRGRRRRDRDG